MTNMPKFFDKFYILGHLFSQYYVVFKCELNEKIVIFILLWTKWPKFNEFGNKVIRHIKMAIRHMWRVANGLDNAAINNGSNAVSRGVFQQQPQKQLCIRMSQAFAEIRHFRKYLGFK